MKNNFKGLVLILLFCSVVHIKAQVEVNGISPKQIIGGMAQILTITGKNFGSPRGNSYVAFYQESGNYMNAATAQSLNYLTWSDTKIELEMPVAFSGKVKVNINGTDYSSADTLKVKANVNYRAVNPLLYDLLSDRNGKGAYTWHMHSIYWNNPEAKAAIEAVFMEFRCKTGVNYILANEPSDAALTLSDNINLIAPDSVLNAAGYNDKLWSSCVLGGTTFYHNTNMDVRMTTKENWYFGAGKAPAGRAKFRYVLLHELGHSLGLGHVNELGQTMYPSVTLLPSDNWSTRDSITAEERTAIGYYVNLSKNFTFRACSINPLKSVSDCTDVYGNLLKINTVLSIPLSCSPNPGNGVFVFNRAVDAVEVYNVQGQLVFKINSRVNSIDLSVYPAGLYHTKIVAEKAVIYSRLIKM